MMGNKLLIALLVLLPMMSHAQSMEHNMSHGMSSHSPIMKMAPMMSPEACGDMMVWDRTTSSCIVVPRADRTMRMWMIHGNGFLVQDYEEGSRGRNEISAPHMLMADYGESRGNHYFNMNLMLSFEKWTFPNRGYPLLLQIGESDSDDRAYIDAQHPHSSPIMGLTFSDTMRIGEGSDYLRFFFAPRGQATEGPVAFMHRVTGMVNPDAPLGHHIGQDVSHITSTVLGASLNIGKVGMEASVFNGREPEPTKVDLPLGPLNSYGLRLSYEFGAHVFAMLSAAEVKDPEIHDPDIERIWRYSGSLYSQHSITSDWKLDNTLIYGHVNFYDRIPVLRSVLDEFWLHQDGEPHQYWGRLEFVERSGSELAIANIESPEKARWVTALTAGYTYKKPLMDELEGGVGFSVTKDFLPRDFRAAYSGEPLSARIFLQLTGMTMGHF